MYIKFSNALYKDTGMYLVAPKWQPRIKNVIYIYKILSRLKLFFNGAVVKQLRVATLIFTMLNLE